MGKRLRNIIPEAVVPYSTHEGNPYHTVPEYKAIVRTATVGPHQLKIIHSVDQPLLGFNNPRKVMKVNYKVDNSYVKRQEIAPNHARDILHTVIHSIKDVIKTHKPNEVQFDAADQDNNPNYEALANHLAKHFGGTVDHHMGQAPGGKEIKKFKVLFPKPTNEAVLPYQERIYTPVNSDLKTVNHRAFIGDKDHLLDIDHNMFVDKTGSKVMRTSFRINGSYKNAGLEPHHTRDVLHTVIHSMKETIRNHKPDVVEYDAENQANNPNYKALSHHLAQHFKGQAEVSIKHIPRYGSVQQFHVRLPNHEQQRRNET
jgi:archaellin